MMLTPVVEVEVLAAEVAASAQRRLAVDQVPVPAEPARSIAPIPAAPVATAIPPQAPTHPALKAIRATGRMRSPETPAAASADKAAADRVAAVAVLAVAVLVAAASAAEV